MSLLENAMTLCVRLVESDNTRSDGMGGTTPRWEPGGTFAAAFALARSEPSRAGERDGASDAYQVSVRRETLLNFHDVFQRLTDGAVFRVLSNGDDCRTPDGARLDMRQVRAERWSLPE